MSVPGLARRRSRGSAPAPRGWRRSPRSACCCSCCWPCWRWSGRSTSAATRGVQESPGSGIPPVYLPVYAAAEHAYGVNRWLLASIHLQESDFSRLRARSLAGDAVSARAGTRAGRRGRCRWGSSASRPTTPTTAGGCSAGPTWAAHRRAFARAAARAARRATRSAATSFPRARACRARDGCVYDDFDAILGAAHKLRADGATPQPRRARHAARGVRVHRHLPGRRHLLRRAAARQGVGGGGAGRAPAAAERRGRRGRADLAGERAGRLALRDALGRDARGDRHRRGGRHADPRRAGRAGRAAAVRSAATASSRACATPSS